MAERDRTALKAVLIDGTGGAVAAALVLALRHNVTVDSDFVRLGVVVAALLLPAYFLAVMFSAKRTVEMLDASPHFDLLREAGFTEEAKGRVMGSIGSAGLMLCCAVTALYTMNAWPAETVLALVGVFVVTGRRALSALRITGAALRIYETAERRLSELERERYRQ